MPLYYNFWIVARSGYTEFSLFLGSNRPFIVFFFILFVIVYTLLLQFSWFTFLFIHFPFFPVLRYILLLYCYQPRMAPLIVGNIIVINFLYWTNCCCCCCRCCCSYSKNCNPRGWPGNNQWERAFHSMKVQLDNKSTRFFHGRHFL